MDKTSLNYIDEDDRCYGLAGMAMGIVIWDAEELVADIDLDAPVDEMMHFTPQYYFAGNPRLSARLAWNHLVEHYRLTMGLVLSNVLCRQYVYRSVKPDVDRLRELLHTLADEGQEACSLDNDEVTTLFNNHLQYLTRLYNHSGVTSVVRDFARQLKSTRRMSIHEVSEAFRPLAYL